MKKDEIICAMFAELCERASRAEEEDPRINNKEFAARVAARVNPADRVDEFWMLIQPYFGFIERYCDDKKHKSLAALVVNANGNDISYPGEWFGNYVLEVEWKTPLTTANKRWYHRPRRWTMRRPSGYLWDMCRDWQKDGYVQSARSANDFREWLEKQHRTERHEIAASVDDRDASDRTDSTEALENSGYATDKPVDDHQQTLDSFFNSSAHTGAFGKPRSPQRLKKMMENLVDKADLKHLHDEYYDKYFGFTDYFPWPSPNATLGVGGEFDADMPTKGMFAHFGYHVGKAGKSQEVREKILDSIFHAVELPFVHDAGYVEEFGSPESPQRLRKMANFLAAQARNISKRTDGDCSTAFEAYKSDLVYLHEAYYRDHFGFHEYFKWPDLSFLPEKPQPPHKKPMPKKRNVAAARPNHVAPVRELTGHSEPEQSDDPVPEPAGDEGESPDKNPGENSEGENSAPCPEPLPADEGKSTDDAGKIRKRLALALAAATVAIALTMLLKS